MALDCDDDEDGEHKRRAIHGSKEFFSVCEGCGVAPDKVFVFLNVIYVVFLIYFMFCFTFTLLFKLFYMFLHLL